MNELTMEMIEEAYNQAYPKCKSCGTRKTYIILGCGGKYCKCESEKIRGHPRVSELITLMQEMLYGNLTKENPKVYGKSPIKSIEEKEIELDNPLKDALDYQVKAMIKMDEDSRLKTLKDILEMNGIDYEEGDWGESLVDLRNEAIKRIKYNREGGLKMATKVDKKILNWLTSCPASDTNFKCNLDYANVETLQAALKDKTISKTARLTIERKIRKKQKI